MTTQATKVFRELHFKDDLLVLPNAWDALSAKLFEEAGAQALGTTSAGIAFCYGYPDGEKLPLDLFFTMVERIIRTVKIPVTVDMESGMGQTLDEVCSNIQHVIDLGAAGINIEDGDPKEEGQLISLAQQIEKISFIKEIALRSNSSLFINARTDTYWLHNNLAPEEKLQETLKRLTAYHNAGANGVFVPGLMDLNIIKRISEEIPLPLNILSGTWIPSLVGLRNYGVSRLSTGSSPIRSIATHIKNIGRDVMRAGKSKWFSEAVSYGDINKLFF